MNHANEGKALRAASQRWRVCATLTALAVAGCGDDGGGKDKGCDGGERAKVVDCVDSAAYVDDLAFVAQARPTGNSHHGAVQDYVAKRLEALGYAVTRQTYGVGTNVIGERKGSSQPDELVVIGAHYDGVPGCKAADDNGTGVAGALQAAAALARHSYARTIQVAFWDEEERGLTGSYHHAAALEAAGRKVVGVYDFEMIGYKSDVAQSQKLPAGFDVVFAAVGEYLYGNDFRGDFIAVIYDEANKAPADAFFAAAKTHGLAALAVNLPASYMESANFADLRRSDHTSFWGAGYPGIMLTDTANFRNTHYHCQEGEDSHERLDNLFAIAVVKSTVVAAGELLATTTAAAVAPWQPACDLDAQDCKSGEKCVPMGDGVRYVPTCTPVAAKAVGLHASCTRPNNKLGEDDCGAGLFCTPWGLPWTDPVSRKCVKACRSDAPCAEGEVCVVVGRRAHSGGLAPRRVGVCLQRCDPFAADCGQDMMCGGAFLGVDSLKEVRTCKAAGDKKAGESCFASNWRQCAPGLDCAFGPQGENPTCRSPCDAAHPCGAGASCVPDGYALEAGLGHCF